MVGINCQGGGFAFSLVKHWRLAFVGWWLQCEVRRGLHNMTGETGMLGAVSERGHCHDCPQQRATGDPANAPEGRRPAGGEPQLISRQRGV